MYEDSCSFLDFFQTHKGKKRKKKLKKCKKWENRTFSEQRNLKLPLVMGNVGVYWTRHVGDSNPLSPDPLVDQTGMDNLTTYAYPLAVTVSCCIRRQKVLEDSRLLRSLLNKVILIATYGLTKELRIGDGFGIFLKLKKFGTNIPSNH